MGIRVCWTVRQQACCYTGFAWFISMESSSISAHELGHIFRYINLMQGRSVFYLVPRCECSMMSVIERPGKQKNAQPWVLLPVFSNNQLCILGCFTDPLQVLVAFAAAKSLQLCLTLCNPIDGSLPGSSVHGIFQARVLEWGASAFSVSGKFILGLKMLELQYCQPH